MWQTGRRVTYLPAALSSSEIEPARFSSEEICVEVFCARRKVVSIHWPRWKTIGEQSAENSQVRRCEILWRRTITWTIRFLSTSSFRREWRKEEEGRRSSTRSFLLIISYVSDDVETNYCASFGSPLLDGAFVVQQALPSPLSFLPSFLSLFLIHYHYPEETYSRELTRLTLVALRQSSLE